MVVRTTSLATGQLIAGLGPLATAMMILWELEGSQRILKAQLWV